MNELTIDNRTVGAFLRRKANLRVLAGDGTKTVKAEGRLVAYSSLPSVTIQDADGRQSNWPVTLPMVEVPAAGEPEPGGFGGNATAVTRVFTFGHGQTCPITGIDLYGRYAIAAAGDPDLCRIAMFSSPFAHRWAFPYESVDDATAVCGPLVEHAQVAADGTVKITPHNQPYGPYVNSEDTQDSPFIREIDLQIPGRGTSQVVAERHLVQACRNAGVALGAFDEQILTWLADRDVDTIQVVIGLISRAYAAGQKAGAHRA